jgi:hypothetical protein
MGNADNEYSNRHRRASIAIILAVACFGSRLAIAAQSPASIPDWTGLWVNNESISFDPRVPRATSSNPPYQPAAAAKYRERLAALARGEAVADPTANCVLPGMPRIMNMPYPFEILQTPGRVTILAESMHDVRRIFTDGRAHPEDLDPTYNGHSIGRWEGSVLVVETVGMRGDTVFDQTGAFHSGRMRVIERFREVSPGVLQDEITVEDAEVFARPWTVTKTYHRAPAGEEIIEYVCQENNRNPIDAEGKTSVTLSTQPKR